MNPLIEKKLAELDEEFTEYLMPPEYHAMGMNGGSHPVMENLKVWLRTALQEALLAGIEMAEGVVPEEFLMTEQDEIEFTRVGVLVHAKNQRHAFNVCRAQILAAITTLKESIRKNTNK